MSVNLGTLVSSLSDASTGALGSVVASLVTAGEVSSDELGAVLRCVSPTPIPTPQTVNNVAVLPAPGTPGEVAVATGADLPENENARTGIRNTVYGSFNGDFRRRSIAGLARLTGLNENAVLELVAESEDFELIVGSSGTQFVRVRSL